MKGKTKLDEKGWYVDGKGVAVHPDRVKVEDKIKSEMIDKILGKATEVKETIRTFKNGAYDDVNSYFELLEQEYGLEPKKGAKGNFTLENFSRTAKIQVAVSDNIVFDEKLQIAKRKIDEYLHEITEDSSSDIQTLISKAFDVDKQGLVSPQKILNLRTYDITHKKWQEAMEIIANSIKVDSTKEYIRFYTRESADKKYKQVSLDMAGV